MTTPTQIPLTILAPGRAVESADRLIKPDRPGEPRFDHFLKQEVNQPRPDPARREERRPPEPDPSRSSAPSTETEPRARRAPEPHPAETRGPESTRPEKTSSGPRPSAREAEPETHAPLGAGQPGPTAEDRLVQSLKDLNVEAERIQTILETIRRGPAARDVMDALAGLLGALAAVTGEGPATGGPEAPRTLAGLLQNTGQPTDSAVQLSRQHQQIVDVLVEAGLTREQAQKLLTAARQGNLSDNLEDIRIQLARATEEGTVTEAPASKPSSNSSEAPRERAAAAQLPEQKETDPALQRLLDRLGNSQPKRQGQEPSGTAAANRPEGASALLARQPVLSLSHQSNGTPAASPRLEGGPGQPPGALSEGGPRPVEAPRPAIPQSYSPRALGEKPVTQQIIERISVRSVGQQKEIFIKLEPPSLGTVRMNVSTTGDHVKTTLVAENHAVKQTIENNLAQLKDALNGQGVKVDSFTVLVGGHPGQNAPHQRQEGPAARFFGSQHAQEDGRDLPVEMPPARPAALYYPSQSISVFA